MLEVEVYWSHVWVPGWVLVGVVGEGAGKMTEFPWCLVVWLLAMWCIGFWMGRNYD